MGKSSRWKILSVSIVTAVLATAFVSNSASAQTTICRDIAESCTSILPGSWCYGGAGIVNILQLVLNIMTMGIGVLATIGMVLSGIQWLTARDREEQIVKTKSRIFNIVIGVITWGLLWLVLSWLMPNFSTSIPILDSLTEKKETCLDAFTAEEIAQMQENNGSTGEANTSFSGYNQFSAPWGSKNYGSCGAGNTYADAGCGPSGVASIITGMTGKKVTPDEIGSKAVARGHRVCGKGSADSIVTIVKDYGLRAGGTVSRTDISAMSNHLKNGAMLFVSIKSNSALSYSGAGHFIVIRGITSSGKWLVYDSNGNKGQNNATKEFTPSSLTSSFKRDPNVVFK